MAIKVVQGLIDVGRTDGSSSQKVTSTKVVSDREASGRQPQLTQATQSTSVLAQSAVAATVTGRGLTEAAISVVRTRAGSGEQKPLRDPKDAERIAATVAERVGTEDESGGGTHSKLKPENARPHFQ